MGGLGARSRIARHRPLLILLAAFCSVQAALALQAALSAATFLQTQCSAPAVTTPATEARTPLLLCSLSGRVALQQASAGASAATLTGTTVIAGAAGAQSDAPAVLDLSASNASSSNRPLLALGANATLLLRDLALEGAALVLPSPLSAPLPLAQLLALRAVQLPSGGAQLVLQNVRITTPSCVALSVHQAAACRALALSPHLTVAPGLLRLRQWSSPSLSATNVTLTCSGPPAPHPCVAVAVGSGQELVDVLYGTYGTAAAAAASSGPVAPTYILISRDITLAGAIVPVGACGTQALAPPPLRSTASALAPAFPPTQPGPCTAPVTSFLEVAPPMAVTSLLLISGGTLTPLLLTADGGRADSSAPGGNDSAPTARAPVLDLGGASNLLDLTSQDCSPPACRVEVHNLSLSGLPLGPPMTYTAGLLRGFIWLFKAPRSSLGASAGLLLVRNVSLLLDPEEVAVWMFTTAFLGHLKAAAPALPPPERAASNAAAGPDLPAPPPRPPPPPGPPLGTYAEGLAGGWPCASWLRTAPQGLLVMRAPGQQPALLLTLLTSGSSTSIYEDVLFTSSLAQDGAAGASSPDVAAAPPYAAAPCGFPLWPGCGPAGSAVGGGSGAGAAAGSLNEGTGSTDSAPQPAGGSGGGSNAPPPAPGADGPAGTAPLPAPDPSAGEGGVARSFAAACRMQPWGGDGGGWAGAAEVTPLRSVTASEDFRLQPADFVPNDLIIFNITYRNSSTTYQQPLRLMLLHDALLVVGLVEARDPKWQGDFGQVQAFIRQPGVLLGDPAGPRILDLSARPALFNLRAPSAALTLRDLVLVGAPAAGLHPAQLRAQAAGGSGPAASAGTAADDATAEPPAGLSPAEAAAAAATAPAGATASSGEAAGSHAGLGPTSGLPPGLANFTSCLWTLDFDRRRAAAELAGSARAPLPPVLPQYAALWWRNLPEGSPRPAALPRATLDGVVLLVPYRELRLLAWCAAYDSTAPLADPWVAAEVAAMLAGSQLLAPGLVRRQLAEAEAAAGYDGAGGVWGGSKSNGTDPGMSAPPLSSSPLRSITFWVFSWCGLYGRNVTLASELPYTSAAPYTAAATSTLELPARWSFLAAAGAPRPPAPEPAPPVLSGAGADPPAPARSVPLPPAAQAPPVLPPPASPTVYPEPSEGGLQAGPVNWVLRPLRPPPPALPPPLPMTPGAELATAEGWDGVRGGGGELTPAAVAGIAVAGVAALLAAVAAAAWLMYARQQRMREPDGARGKEAAVVCSCCLLQAPPAAASTSGEGSLSGTGLSSGGGPIGRMKTVGAVASTTSTSTSGPASTPSGARSPAALANHVQSALAQMHLGISAMQAEAARGARPPPPSAAAAAPAGAPQLPQQGASWLPLPPPPSCARPGAGTHEPPPHDAGRRASGARSGRPSGGRDAANGRSHGKGAEGGAPAPTRGPDVGRWMRLEAESLMRLPLQSGDGGSFWDADGASTGGDGTSGGAASPDGGDSGGAAGGQQPPLRLSSATAGAVLPLAAVADEALVLTGELGRGAQGVVYSGRWRGLEVAVKSILLTGAQDGDVPSASLDGYPSAAAAAVAAAQSEAAIATSMAHPNLVACYKFELAPLRVQPQAGGPEGSAAGAGSSLEAEAPDAWRLTLVMERCNGGSVRSFLAAGWGAALAAIASSQAADAAPTDAGAAAPPQAVVPPRPPLPAAAVARLALDVARGVAYLHGRGVAHGDLSSANVLLHLLPYVRAPTAAGLQPSLCQPGRTQGGAQALSPHSSPLACPPAPAELLSRLAAKVCDFGLSRQLGRQGPGTGTPHGGEHDRTHMTGPCRRSSAYSAPELVRHGHTGYKQDVYAFGVLLWELAAGLPLPELLLRPEGRRVREWLRAQAEPGVLAQALPPELLEWPPWGSEGGAAAGPEPRPASEACRWWSGLAELAGECLREQPAERPSCAQLCARLELFRAAAEQAGGTAGRHGGGPPVGGLRDGRLPGGGRTP